MTFLDIFDSNLTSDCVLDSCFMMKGGDCETDLPATTDILLGVKPFSITATELNPSGYSYSICYRCNVKPTGLALISFDKDQI